MIKSILVGSFAIIMGIFSPLQISKLTALESDFNTRAHHNFLQINPIDESLEEIKGKINKASDVQWVMINNSPRNLTDEELAELIKLKGDIFEELMNDDLRKKPKDGHLDTILPLIAEGLGKNLKGLSVRDGRYIRSFESFKQFEKLEFLRIDSLDDNYLREITSLPNLKTLKILYGTGHCFLIKEALENPKFQLNNLEYIAIDFFPQGMVTTPAFKRVIEPKICEKLPKVKAINFTKKVFIFPPLNDSVLKEFTSSPLAKQAEAIVFQNIICFWLSDREPTLINKFESMNIKKIGINMYGGDIPYEKLKEIYHHPSASVTIIQDTKGFMGLGNKVKYLDEETFLWRYLMPEIPEEFLAYSE